jgi:hypothetical protein
MSNNFGEIIKKPYFLVCWKARQRTTHATPPPLLLRHIFHRLDGKCEPQVRDLLASITRGRGGEGGVICKTMPFDNGSSDQLQTQNQDSQYHSAPLLFKQDLSNSYWWFMASFSEFREWREAIKGSRSQWPALNRLHCILQATPL